MLSEAEILQFINEDRISTKKHLAKMGERYYEGDHDIRDYRMFYFNADGKLVEDKTRSNIKISHPFFTELVDQEVQYMLSGAGSFVKSDDQDLQYYLDQYFDDEFKSELNDVLTGTVSKGFDYMYAYQRSDDRIGFQHADSMGVVEVREKDTDDHCAYVIYWYVDRIGKENKLIKRVQVWDTKQTVFYVQTDEGKLLLDTDEPLNPRPHIIYSKDNDSSTYYEEFGFIPFFRLDNNRKQFSGLKPIKDLIDDYDMMSCGLSNNLADFDHPLHVVKGFQGDNLEELSVNLKTKKLVGIDSTGDVEVRTIDIPYQARQVKMQEDEKNIYRFGMGFNSAQVGDGNVTNVVIKSRYALLDLKCNKLEMKLKQFLKNIVSVVLAEINRNHESDYDITDVYFDFQREVMTNAQDNMQIELVDAQKKQTEINTLLSLANVLDDDTIIQNICEVLELNYHDLKDKIDFDDGLASAELSLELGDVDE